MQREICGDSRLWSLGGLLLRICGRFIMFTLSGNPSDSTPGHMFSVVGRSMLLWLMFSPLNILILLCSMESSKIGESWRYVLHSKGFALDYGRCVRYSRCYCGHYMRYSDGGFNFEQKSSLT